MWVGFLPSENTGLCFLSRHSPREGEILKGEQQLEPGGELLTLELPSSSRVPVEICLTASRLIDLLLPAPHLLTGPVEAVSSVAKRSKAQCA